MKMEKEDTDGKQLSAVTRTINVLETLSSRESINLEQLAKETELPKATLLRFLGTLAFLGYVQRDPYDRYSLTAKMFSIGSRSLEHTDLIRVTHPIAGQLSEELGETVHLGIRADDTAVYVLKIESKYTIRMHSRVGKSMPLYCTAIGKLLLADAEKNELREVLARIRQVPFTSHTIRTATALEKELDGIRADGWAMDREEHEEGITCIGAPVRDHTGKTIAAISVSWPVFRFEAEKTEHYVTVIRDAANRISKLLGYIPKS